MSKHGLPRAARRRRDPRHFLADKSLEAHFKGPWPSYNFIDALQTKAGAQGRSLENRPV